MKYSRFVLFISLFVLFVAHDVRAATGIGPVVSYEIYTRTKPEISDVARLGGGLRLQADIIAPVLVFESSALYSNEQDTFSSLNTFSEQAYRFRIGLLVRLFHVGPLYFAVRGGPQFSWITNEYRIMATGEKRNSSLTYVSPYVGGELQLIPFAGFGLQLGATFYKENSEDRWIPQFLFGVSI